MQRKLEQNFPCRFGKGWEQKWIHFSLGNKSSLDFDNPGAHLFPLAPAQGVKSYQSYELLIPTAPNASKNNCRNTMQADFHRKGELALSNTFPRLSLRSSQKWQEQLHVSPPGFLPVLVMIEVEQTPERCHLNISRNLSLKEVAWTKEWFDGEFKSSSETRPCGRESQVPLALGNIQLCPTDACWSTCQV